MMNQRDASTLQRFQDLLDASIQHCFHERCQKPLTDQELRRIRSTFCEPLATVKENLSATETHNDALHSNTIRAAQVHENVKNTRVLSGAVVMIKQVCHAVCFCAHLHFTLNHIRENKEIDRGKCIDATFQMITQESFGDQDFCACNHAQCND